MNLQFKTSIELTVRGDKRGFVERLEMAAHSMSVCGADGNTLEIVPLVVTVEGRFRAQELMSCGELAGQLTRALIDEAIAAQSAFEGGQGEKACGGCCGTAPNAAPADLEGSAS